MSDQEQVPYVLGVMVDARLVQGVLLRIGADGVEFVRRFTRQRTAVAGVGAETALPGMGGELPEVEEGDDYSVQFGEGKSSNALFLESEFGDLERTGAGEAVEKEPELFSLELSDILAECRDAGFEEVPMAFCLPASEVEQVVLAVPADTASEGASREQLLDVLREEHPAPFDKERVAFLPMTRQDASRPDGGMVRYLALIPRATEPVVPTLQLMQKEQRRPLPPVEFLDAELAVYVGLARTSLKQGGEDVAANDDFAPDTDGSHAPPSTLVVRAGDEGTLVFFMQGENLHHATNLRSLTAFDAPETICSRVLLLQDEYDIGDIDHVLVSSEESEAALVDSFEMFFPDATTRALIDVLPHGQGEDVADELSPAAMGTALRMAGDTRYTYAFEKVDMLPSGMLKRRMRMPIAWPSVAALVVLFLTVLFFTWRYTANEQRIAEQRQELRTFTNKMEQVNPQELQASIDSLDRTATSIMQALEVLDELLIGSDRWSRTLATSSRQIGAVGGIWVESWSPQGETLQLEGNATSRDRVVNLAQRLEAEIMSLSFSEIREWPVYSFTMTVPLPNKLPRAAEYLRAQAAATDSEQVQTSRPASYTP